MADKEAAIDDLRRRMKSVEPLPEEENFFTCDETLARYLKSRDWKIEDAEAALKATVEYRRKLRPHRIVCQWCEERPGYHSMRQVGFDEVGRPVIYANFAQAATYRNSEEDAIAHCMYLFENAKVTMKPGISTWVFIIDCTGMTIPACNPKLGYGVTQVMANHYPERLGMVVCLNHNPVFHGVWKAIKVFLHKNTVSKMRFVRSKQKIIQLFQKYFDDELANWLLEEIKRNRVKPLPKSQMKFWADPVSGDHDPRGCPSYVSEFIEPYMDKMARSPSGQEYRVHRPHPNIIDCLQGRVKDIQISPEEALAREKAQSLAATSAECVVERAYDSEDDNINGDKLEIADEFQIPVDAKTLTT